MLSPRENKIQELCELIRQLRINLSFAKEFLSQFVELQETMLQQTVPVSSRL